MPILHGAARAVARFGVPDFSVATPRRMTVTSTELKSATTTKETRSP